MTFQILLNLSWELEKEKKTQFSPLKSEKNLFPSERKREREKGKRRGRKREKEKKN